MPRDAETLARVLLKHARLVASILRQSKRRGSPSLLKAVAVAQTMVSLADDVLQELGEQARREGHTWQEIGDVLGTSRQAAFQRFERGGD